MYIEHLQQVFHEVKRILKPSGSLWLVLGDTYYTKSGSNFQGSTDSYSAEAEKVGIRQANGIRELFNDGKWLQSKQKMLIPERVAIALQDDGWILRNTIVWHKVNHMPSSVTDRLTNAWESMFFFVKSPWYYFDLQAIRKPVLKLDNGKRTNLKNKWKETGVNSPLLQHAGINLNPAGANPGDVWSLTNECLKMKHYAAFPQKLIRRVLEASAPKQICLKCGKPRIRITKTEGNNECTHSSWKIAEVNGVGPYSIFRTGDSGTKTFTLGWSDCGCNSGFQSAVILDPFAGAGTALLVAHKMGYDWLGIELVPKYCDIIEKRIAQHGRIRLDAFTEKPLVQLACDSTKKVELLSKTSMEK